MYSVQKLQSKNAEYLVLEFEGESAVMIIPEAYGHLNV